MSETGDRQVLEKKDDVTRGETIDYSEVSSPPQPATGLSASSPCHQVRVSRGRVVWVQWMDKSVVIAATMVLQPPTREADMAWSAEVKERRRLERERLARLPTIRCSCGAVWKGRYAEKNEVIDAHRGRSTCVVTVVARSSGSSSCEAEKSQKKTKIL